MPIKNFYSGREFSKMLLGENAWVAGKGVVCLK